MSSRKRKKKRKPQKNIDARWHTGGKKLFLAMQIGISISPFRSHMTEYCWCQNIITTIIIIISKSLFKRNSDVSRYEIGTRVGYVHVQTQIRVTSNKFRNGNPPTNKKHTRKWSKKKEKRSIKKDNGHTSLEKKGNIPEKKINSSNIFGLFSASAPAILLLLLLSLLLS